MTNPTSPKPKTRFSYSIRPKGLPPEDLQEVIRRLTIILSELAKIKVDLGKKVVESSHRRKQLLLEVSDYLSEVKIAQLLLHVPCNAPTFDDHDLVASLLLHRFSYYEHVRHPRNPGKRWHIDSFVDKWKNLLPARKHSVLEILKGHGLRSRPEFDFSEPTSLNIGILTVLEHEYQSVVRRFDRIFACSGNYADGLAIRYRTHPTEDLKDISTRLGNVGHIKTGWTIGVIAHETVLAICIGDVGQDNARSRIDEIQERLNLVVENWLDVGVCAGSNQKWPIGTVLLSEGKVIDLKRTGTYRFAEADVITPLTLSIPTSGNFSLHDCYRRVPQGVVGKVRVAPPKDVPVFPVKFACVPDVIRGTKDRDELRLFLKTNGHLSQSEHFGMEMEAAGTTLYGESPTMCIIKGVCDYGDDSKASWPLGVKVLYQLYAAETAADYAMNVIRDWKNQLEPKTKRRPNQIRPRTVNSKALRISK